MAFEIGGNITGCVRSSACTWLVSSDAAAAPRERHIATPPDGSSDIGAQLLVPPSANRKMICARGDSDAGRLCERAIDSNCARSAIVTFGSLAARPTCISEWHSACKATYGTAR